MLGIVSTALIVGLVFTIIVILINSGLLLYLAYLLEFSDRSYKTALLVSAILGIINFALSVLALFVKIMPLILEIVGIIVYLVIAYVLITWRYAENRKLRVLATILMTLFSFALSFVVMSLLTLFFNTLVLV